MEKMLLYVVLMFALCSVQHCHCGEETQKTIDSIHAEFNKVELIHYTFHMFVYMVCVEPAQA